MDRVQRISVPGPGGTLHALLDTPLETPAGAALLLHGANNDSRQPLLADTARALAERGWLALRFDFSYVGRGSPSPDRRRELAEARAALAVLRRRAPAAPVALVGKSLGGRVATILAAEDAGVARVAVYGYPLHQMGHPERPTARTHFHRLSIPILIFCGEGDPLCAPESLRAAMLEMPRPAEIAIVPNANHSLEPRRKGEDAAALRASVVARAVEWLTGART
jgi:predicted alpha/beta-hydrolase family hydrolase